MKEGWRRGGGGAAARQRISFVKIAHNGNAGIPDLSIMHFRQQPKGLLLFKKFSCV